MITCLSLNAWLKNDESNLIVTKTISVLGLKMIERKFKSEHIVERVRITS